MRSQLLYEEWDPGEIILTDRFKTACPQKLFPKEIELEQTASSNFCSDLLWDSSVSEFE